MISDLSKHWSLGYPVAFCKQLIVTRYQKFRLVFADSWVDGYGSCGLVACLFILYICLFIPLCIFIFYTYTFNVSYIHIYIYTTYYDFHIEWNIHWHLILHISNVTHVLAIYVWLLGCIYSQFLSRSLVIFGWFETGTYCRMVLPKKDGKREKRPFFCLTNPQGLTKRCSID